MVVTCEQGSRPPSWHPRVRVIAKSVLREFWEVHPDAERPLRAWYREAEADDWKTPAEIKRRYPSASLLAGGRVVFNISGNKYRLIVRIRYEHHVVYVRFLGTHDKYDTIDAANV